MAVWRAPGEVPSPNQVLTAEEAPLVSFVKAMLAAPENADVTPFTPATATVTGADTMPCTAVSTPSTRALPEASPAAPIRPLTVDRILVI
ncbi:hypothetical protein FEG63_21420 [Mycolicibacterium sphagni]|uniref:Uncharacterized protein n=1 Tax=Mycolicibacterium sphagni TaxID=1786 RepID=A0ABX2JWJ4_9MYCO|nr:hypothetical protein [Mycolicibacterium sphagni]